MSKILTRTCSRNSCILAKNMTSSSLAVMSVKGDLELVMHFILMVRLKEYIFDFEVPIQNKSTIPEIRDVAIQFKEIFVILLKHTCMCHK